MSEPFSNTQVNPLLLPTVSEIEFSQLNKEYLTLGLIASSIFWGFSLIVFLIVIFFRGDEFPQWLTYLILSFIILIASLVIITQILGFKRKQYALREKDVIYKSGLIWRSVTVIPFNRIQHAEVYQGPLDRLFNLSNLRIYTAGGSSSDLSIPGLRPDNAHKMKHYIINKTSVDEEE